MCIAMVSTILKLQTVDTLYNGYTIIFTHIHVCILNCLIEHSDNYSIALKIVPPLKLEDTFS